MKEWECFCISGSEFPGCFLKGLFQLQFRRRWRHQPSVFSFIFLISLFSFLSYYPPQIQFFKISPSQKRRPCWYVYFVGKWHKRMLLSHVLRCYLLKLMCIRRRHLCYSLQASALAERFSSQAGITNSLSIPLFRSNSCPGLWGFGLKVSNC